MRWTGIVVVASLLCAAGSAFAHQPGCATCGEQNYRGLDAGACAGPAGYCLAPGCCEPHRHCCDNAWDGYCEHRAKVDAFWSHVGTRGAYGHATAYRPAPVSPCTTCPSKVEDRHLPTVAPTTSPALPAPAASPTPAPPVPGNIGAKSALK